MSTAPATVVDPLLDLRTYTAELDAWLTSRPDCLDSIDQHVPAYDQRVEGLRSLMGALFSEGWSRYGWPEQAGGLGGDILHRGALWEALARHGLPGMALFEHHEILAPTLVAKGPAAFVAERLPEFLSGRELWCQGFSEPDAGSDLASIRTTARLDGDQWVINGRKIWTSWARYARWCLVLARTGDTDSRHHGLSALIVDLEDPGVEVRAIQQANGTDELAEVTFDDVRVSVDRVVGEVDGGWAVAMHILSHERGTFAWFRHCFLYQHLIQGLEHASGDDDLALGNVLLDLAAVTAAGHFGLRAHATGVPLGPFAAYSKLLLCAAEQSVNDWILSNEPELTLDTRGDASALRRQEYLFSRIVTVYGGSQQMQLDTIAKQILRLPVTALLPHFDEYTDASRQALRKTGGDAALDALGWWDLLPHLDQLDIRVPALALFRAQGQVLSSTPALGALMAQPYLDSAVIAPGTVVAAVPFRSARDGDAHVVVGELGDRRLLVDRPGHGVKLFERDDVDLHRLDIAGRLELHRVEATWEQGTVVHSDTDAAGARARSTFLGRVALSLEILGAAESILEVAVTYAGDRKQFGQEIGRFQAVRHLLAWARTDCSAMESLSKEAAALDAAAPARLEDIAKAIAGRNGRKVCERALQVLGGIGFTTEHEHHHHHSRVLALDALVGSSADLTRGLGRWLRTSSDELRLTSGLLVPAGE